VAARRRCGGLDNRDDVRKARQVCLNVFWLREANALRPQRREYNGSVPHISVLVSSFFRV
jgi:hypothetical protein